MTALIVDDNPTDAMLLVKALGSRIGQTVRAASLAECLQTMETRAFDVVLLDLGLPDSRGLDTLTAVRRKAPDTTIIVLTGSEDESLGIGALQAGAQDYLPKHQIEPAALGRVIRYAVERQRQGASEDAARQAAEVQQLSRVHENPSTSITAQMYGGVDLREGYPDLFAQLLGRYSALLETAVEERTFRVVSSTLAEDLRTLSHDLAVLRGGPRDVVEIHVTCLRNALETAPAPRTKAYVEEGRILVLELMGFLAGFYRNYYPVLRDGSGRTEKRST